MYLPGSDFYRDPSSGAFFYQKSIQRDDPADPNGATNDEACQVATATTTLTCGLILEL